MSRFVIALTLATAACAHSTPASSWHRFESKHVVLTTDVDRSRGRALITDVEKFRATLSRITGIPFEDASPKIHIFAFGRQRDYERASRVSGSLGFYTTKPAGAVSMLSLEDGDKSWTKELGAQVLRHEYTHHLLHQFSPMEYPRWYDEGFAEYVSTMEFDGSQVILGKAPVRRLIALRAEGDWLTTEQLVESRGRYLGWMGSNLSRDEDKYRVGIYHQYAQGWLVVHFLNHTQRFRAGIGPYLAALADGKPANEDVFEQHFGVDYSEFDQALRNYWGDRNLSYATIDMTGQFPAFDVQHEELSPEESAAIIYMAKHLSGRLPENEITTAHQVFKGATRFRPALLTRLRAELMIRQKRWDDAVALAESLEAMMGPQPIAWSHELQARVLLKREGEESEPSPQALATAKGHATKAIRSDPTYVPGFLRYVEISLAAPESVDDETLELIDVARFLAPDLKSAKRLELRVLAASGNHELALKKLDSMVEWASSKREAQELSSLRKKLIAARDGGAS